MIRSFSDKETKQLFKGERVTRFQAIESQAMRHLAQLDAAATLSVLADVPGNRLEKLVGDRKDQHSIRINQQWRICFRWTDEGPVDVEIVDYH